MKVVWRPMADADRESIFGYIAQDNPGAALELDEEFQAKAEHSRQRPNLYKPGRVKGTREIMMRPNYVMIIASKTMAARFAFCACFMRPKSDHLKRVPV